MTSLASLELYRALWCDFVESKYTFLKFAQTLFSAALVKSHNGMCLRRKEFL